MSRTAEEIISDPAIWHHNERPDRPGDDCDICGELMPINMMTALFGVHLECWKDYIMNTILLLIDRQQAIKIRDGATLDGCAFTVYDPEDATPLNEVIAITIQMSIWERMVKGQHDQSDVQAIAGQCRLQLGG